MLRARVREQSSIARGVKRRRGALWCGDTWERKRDETSMHVSEFSPDRRSAKTSAQPVLRAFPRPWK